MNTHTLSERISLRRKELGYSQQRLADLVKVSYVTVYKWEGGETAPKGKNLFALSKALKCSPTWLLFGDEDQVPLPAEQIPVELDDRQKRLLDLFDSLPESEKENQIRELEARVENFNHLFEELLNVRKQNAAKKQ
ncbi:helix-turn-helix domain-containing protein [Pantoea sp. JZ2]|uniref:helix-turn-helix domain-containing protein n=1 Tax=Pantoea sp. JZ2 TaxID=2654189 RepID=UPI002B47A5DE|nr:helix-turn-helix domain-containing protein [Pantoea sp. JZ2]WRH15298.1 helix-turn-helix domain-containing protein [Pantoea sp. JZ2]